MLPHVPHVWYAALQFAKVNEEDLQHHPFRKYPTILNRKTSPLLLPDYVAHRLGGWQPCSAYVAKLWHSVGPNDFVVFLQQTSISDIIDTDVLDESLNVEVVCSIQLLVFEAGRQHKTTNQDDGY